MLRETGEFLILTALIVVVARFLLYQPAKGITQRLKFSEHGAGQLLGYLTSVPELVATIAVAATGLMATVAYNILSSNIINVLLALLAAGMYRQLRHLLSRKYWREQVLIAVSILIPVSLLFTNQITSAWTIPTFIAAYIGYLFVIRRISTDGATPTEPHPGVHVEASHRFSIRTHIALNGLIIAVALVGLYFLGTALGDTVHQLGTTFGVPEIILGALIGVVTSLPELTTFFSSYSWHRSNGSDRANEEVVHNTLASNVSNLLIIQTVGLGVFLLAVG